MSQDTSTPGQRNTPPGDTPTRIRNALGPFGMIPAGVIESGLSDAAVRLYAYLWRRTQNENYGRPSMSTIGRDLGWSREKAKNTIRKLEETGLLTVVPRYDEDGAQQTNDYLLEWSSDYAPVVPYPEHTPKPSREATPPLFTEEAPPEEAPEPTSQGGGVADDPPPGYSTTPPGGHPRPQGGSPATPKEDNTPSPNTRGADSTTEPAERGTASPAARATDAWADAYAVAHTVPATAPTQAKATRTAAELLAQGLALEVVSAAARAAGADGSPWIDRYIARVTRVPGAAQAAPAAPWSGHKRTYGAPAQDATPTPTATRPGEACPTHPGYPASNCGGCRADALGDDTRATRPYVDRRAVRT